MTNTNTPITDVVVQYGVAGEPTASFHATLHRRVAEADLKDAPPNRDVVTVITATTGEATGSFYPAVPDDPRERERFCVAVAHHLKAEGVVAAAMTSTGVNPRSGGELVVVMASDGRGGAESWVADVVRDGVNPPRMRRWQRVEMGGRFMCMLHVGVGNNAGVRRLTRYGGIPPEFAQQS